MFGSVLYRRDAIAGVAPDHAAFGTLADRPFLLAIMQRWSAALLRDPLAWYAATTTRRATRGCVPSTSCGSLRSIAPPCRGRCPPDRALFYTYTGYWLFALYDLTPDHQRPPFARFLFTVWSEGLYQPKWRGRFGLRLLQRAVIGGSAASR